MLRLATDADVHGDIVRGLRRRCPTLDLVRVQDALPPSAPDVDVLAWATAEGRVLVTNDRTTMTAAAWEQSRSGQSLPGVIVTTNAQAIGQAIDDIELIAEALSAAKVARQLVIFLPLR